jgi:hypothetical protein
LKSFETAKEPQIIKTSRPYQRENHEKYPAEVSAAASSWKTGSISARATKGPRNNIFIQTGLEFFIRLRYLASSIIGTGESPDNEIFNASLV